MGVILAITQFLIIAVICIIEVNKKSPAVFLWATLMIMFGVMHLLSAFTNSSEYTNQTLNAASLFVIGFCLVYMITRYVLGAFKKENNVVFSYDIIQTLNCNSKYSTLFLVLMYVIVSFMMCYNLVSFSGGIYNTSWSSARDYSASLGYANSNQIYQIIYFSLSGLSLFLWITKKYKTSILCFILGAVVSVLTRNRILVLPILVCLILLFILKIQRLQVKHIIFAGIAGIAVIYLVYGLRVFRHYGTIAVFLRDFNAKEFFDKINLYLVTGNGELGLRNDFYFFLQNNNQFEGFGEWATYIRMLLVYIPTRYSFGLKPADFAQTMGAAVGMVAGGSTHPTLFGDCYANAGMLGIFLGMFWAVYCSIGDKVVIKCKNPALKTLVYCLLAVTYVIIGRGSVYNSFFFVAYGMPFLWIFFIILNKMKLLLNKD